MLAPSRPTQGWRSPPTEPLTLALARCHPATIAPESSRARTRQSTPARRRRASRRACGVDPFAQRHERHAADLPLVEQQHQVAEVSSEPVQAPAHHRVDLVSPNGCCKGVERRPTIFGSADALVDELGGRPATRLDYSRSSRSWFSVVCSDVDTRA